MNLPHHASEERDYIAMRTLTVVRQYLAATFFLVIGLIAYGCGDSATVSEPAALGNLSVSDGTLEPPFTPATTSYIVQLPINISSTTITASPQVAGDSIRIDNQAITSQTITLSSPGAEQSITIVVTDTGTGGTSKSYTVQVKRAALTGNNSLDGLGISPGSLAPTFEADVLRYTASVANGIGSVTITPTLSDPAATMTVNGQPAISGQARSINLQGGGQITTIPITITAQNGSTKTYEVSVSRGPSNNNNLQGLTITPGTLDPSFRANRTGYTVDVGSAVGNVTITPRLQDTTATMTVNGQDTNSGQARAIPLNGAGSPTGINIVVTAQNGSQKPYTITVERAALGGNNNLSGLTVSPGSLNPNPFNANTLSYTVDVGSTVTSVSVTPTRQDPNATITMNGTPATSGQGRSITLNGAGSNTLINIVVAAQNGTQKIYTVNVARAALGGNNNLSGLTVSPGTLNPAFNANTLNYTVNVASTVTSVTVTPTRQDPNAIITMNGTAATSGQGRSVTLNGAGSNTLINIVVTAPNGSQKTYTVNVNRAALGGNNNLSGLTVSPGPLDDPFNANDQNYTVDVASTVTSITVTPTRQDSNATITVNGTPATSGQGRSIPLNGAGSNTSINIVVTAPNGSQKTYTVNVIRAALGGDNNLSGLTVSPGTLSPTFTAARTAYTVNAGSSDTSITVTATPQDPSSTVTINGQGPNSRSIPLPGGPSSTEIEVLVIAPNGTDKTYLVTVNQPAPAAPPAPASAPDLITEDDSCEPGIPDPAVCAPGTSNVDNVTNVNTPRFRVPQPAAGETPSLYVDGAKVSANFDQGANTLAPTAALNDGVRTITSTVTNTATTLESAQSPSLTVTIDTNAPGN